MAEMRRTTSSFRPGGSASASTSVTKPYLYSRVASSSIASVDVDMARFAQRAKCLRLRAKELRVKRQAAAAGAFRVGVVEEKAAAHQACVVVELGALEQRVAFRVDENPRAVRPGEDLVGRPRLFFPREHVLVTGAAARLDADAQTPTFEPVFGEHFMDLPGGVLADLNQNKLRPIWS